MFNIAKRVFLFIAVNLLILVTISIVLNLLGVQPYIQDNGIDYQSLMMFCLVWGMGASFISLLMSRAMAKWFMGVRVLDPENAGSYQWLVNMVTQIAKAAGMNKMPQIGIYDSPDMNAFATGPTKNMSLVAFSTGILSSMSKEEIEGVAAHEISHITNGDMVTMTLIQGVVNAFVMFFARIIAFAVGQSVKDEMRHLVQMITIIVLEICFGLLGMMVVGSFSRKREFRADKGSATLVGRGKMIAALKALESRQRVIPGLEEPASLATLKISGKSGSWMNLMATHPQLSERIKALESFS
ncbi:MAG: protease HtpX [Deltaproteobacteria bacterium]|nr:protease HtpX [Deltaproteobacteria bacterium]